MNRFNSAQTFAGDVSLASTVLVDVTMRRAGGTEKNATASLGSRTQTTRRGRLQGGYQTEQREDTRHSREG